MYEYFHWLNIPGSPNFDERCETECEEYPTNSTDASIADTDTARQINFVPDACIDFEREDK